MRIFARNALTALLVLGLAGCSALGGVNSIQHNSMPLLHHASTSVKNSSAGVAVVVLNSRTGKRYVFKSKVSAEDARIKAMRSCQQHASKINSCVLLSQKGKGNV
jgi:hypothetical protein